MAKEWFRCNGCGSLHTLDEMERNMGREDDLLCPDCSTRDWECCIPSTDRSECMKCERREECTYMEEES